MYPKSIQNLIDKFSKLPSVGPKTAERLVFYLLKSKPENLSALAEAIIDLKNSITSCRLCHNFAVSDPCEICADSRRDRKILCVVAKPQDIATIEKTGIYSGLYYVLMNNFNPLQGQDLDGLGIVELVAKIKSDGSSEIILALNPDMEGETATLYLTKVLKQFPDLKVTRLARGLPMGADLEYADEVTLANALDGRQNIK
ncbi:MAG: recombination mediator RecR [Patescibacteria group bacterium]